MNLEVLRVEHGVGLLNHLRMINRLELVVNLLLDNGSLNDFDDLRSLVAAKKKLTLGVLSILLSLGDGLLGLGSQDEIVKAVGGGFDLGCG